MFCKLYMCVFLIRFLPLLCFQPHCMLRSPGLHEELGVENRAEEGLGGMLGKGGLAPSQVSHKGWKGPGPELLCGNSQHV